MNVDHFDTPSWAVRRLLEQVYLPTGFWLEPCAGNGRVVKAVCEDRPNQVHFTAIEPRKECGESLLHAGVRRKGDIHAVDFLKEFSPYEHRRLHDMPSYFDVAICHPPDAITPGMLAKCMAVAEFVVMLQRIDWLATSKLSFLKNAPPEVYVIPDLISFTENGVPVEHSPVLGDCAWFVWGPKQERFRNEANVHELEPTSEYERYELELQATS